VVEAISSLLDRNHFKNYLYADHQRSKTIHTQIFKSIYTASITWQNFTRLPRTRIYERISEHNRTIRILTLLPGKHGFVIECTLQQVSLDMKHVYEALSYAWGSPDLTDEIQVKGETLKITANLALALRYVRLTDQPLTLWVDAICLYLDRHRTKCRGNLRVGPLFSEGARFTHMG